VKSSKATNNLVLIKTETPAESRMDWLKWLISIVLVLAGLVGNHYYSEFSMPVRTAGWMLVLLMASWVASKTAKGRAVVEFISESQKELRKVVWPTFEETRFTTLIVGVMVIILSLVLWVLDSGLVYVIGWLTGQRG
jgi:preprotein translocase subunit SecE